MVLGAYWIVVVQVHGSTINVFGTTKNAFRKFEV